MAKFLRFEPDTGRFYWLANICNKPIGSQAGCVGAKGYRRIRVDNQYYQANRLAWLFAHGTWPDGQVDHINGQRDDNRAINLRVATNAENQANAKRRSDNRSGFKGVSPTYGQRWRASIKSGGRTRHLGHFDTAEAAHQAYCEAASELFGEFARGA